MNFLVAYSNEKVYYMDANLMETSQQLLLAAKTKAPTDFLFAVLKDIESAWLVRQLISENQEKTF